MIGGCIEGQLMVEKLTVMTALQLLLLLLLLMMMMMMMMMMMTCDQHTLRCA